MTAPATAPGVPAEAYQPAEVSLPLLETTCGSVLRDAAARYPEVPALVEGVPDPAARRRWTYAGLLDDAERAARALLSRFDPGERVAVWAPNLPEWILLQFGAALAGLTLVTVNPLYRAGNAEIDGQTVPILLGDARPTLSPPILSGHTLQGDGQIVVGAATMAELGKRVGDTVVLSYGTPEDAPIYVPPTRLLIVGTTPLPAVGFTSLIADNVSMGTGALVSTGMLPPAFQQAMLSPDPNNNGPGLAFVRMRPGLSAAAGRADMQRVADAANTALAADPNASGNQVTILGVQRPAEIVNFRTMGSTPLLLAGGLALGATAALGLTLIASVRRRRRDLALLKTLGFTRRQLAAVVSWQASVAALLGIIAGVPLGIAAGRQLWVLFARSIYAVPEPAIPVLGVTLVALGSLAFANLIAALPGHNAASTSTALVLRTE